MKFLFLLFVPLSAAVTVVGVAALHAESEREIPFEIKIGPTTVQFQSLGRQSCAASACHGNANAPSLTAAPDKNCWQSSLTHFFAVDPHHKAYEALKSELSTKIRKALRQGTNATIPDAWIDSRCLACHSNPRLEEELSSDSILSLREEGVNCESCHGNAEKWRGSHTLWKATTRTESILGTGFRDLNQIESRAATCAGCHIGSAAGEGLPVRDMNHDMVAAGHPALTDSYAQLLARLPRHWQEKDRSLSGTPERPLNLNGREYEGLRAFHMSMKLISEDRKTRNDNRTPQPELSEQSCVSCHHTLKPELSNAR